MMPTIERQGREVFVYSADRRRRLTWVLYNDGSVYEYRSETYKQYRGRWTWVSRTKETWVHGSHFPQDYMDASAVPSVPTTPNDIPASFI